MNIFDSTLLMEYNAEELFGNIIFNDAAQTEKIIFTDVVNDVIFEKNIRLALLLSNHVIVEQIYLNNLKMMC